MNKSYTFIIFIFLIFYDISILADDENIIIKTSEYTGVIFTKEYMKKKQNKVNKKEILQILKEEYIRIYGNDEKFDSSVIDNEIYWTPNSEDIKKAEIRINIFLNKSPFDFYKNPFSETQIPIILKELTNYIRQYIGKIKKGKKYLDCHFFHNTVVKNDTIWNEYYLNPFGGGEKYWWIEYNVEEDTCDNLRINHPR
ncbi:MAG: hypothetical protein HY934_01085 [Candidatus Firestonebacteria bacterium]|nr:hypothetical protein [Candidatus Firestonebacteria bacterium]